MPKRRRPTIYIFDDEDARTPTPIPETISPTEGSVASCDEDDYHYIRVGRRTHEDTEGDIDTQCIVVAKIDAAKHKLKYIAVATWQLNGLRIGPLHAGDQLNERAESFEISSGLEPDPYFFAWGIPGGQRIRENLLERVAKGELRTVPETLDEKGAERERDEAAQQYLGGREVIKRNRRKVKDGVKNFESLGDHKKRWPHPWALPTTLRSATQRFPDGLQDFDAERVDFDDDASIDVIATFLNKLDDTNLGLSHFIEIAFEPGETLESATKYFQEGEAGGRFGGLNSKYHLSQQWYKTELWVLPQLQGCSTLFKWDDVPELPASAFCDASSLEVDGCEAKLYVEVRIVLDPDHLEVAGEEAESSAE